MEVELHGLIKLKCVPEELFKWKRMSIASALSWSAI